MALDRHPDAAAPANTAHSFVPHTPPREAVQDAAGGGAAGGVFAVLLYDAAGDMPQYVYTVKDLQGNTLGTSVPVQQARPTICMAWPWEWAEWTAYWTAAGDGAYGLACYHGATLILLAALGEHWDWDLG